jgi:hypothetical protein
MAARVLSESAAAVCCGWANVAAAGCRGGTAEAGPADIREIVAIAANAKTKLNLNIFTVVSVNIFLE